MKISDKKSKLIQFNRPVISGLYFVPKEKNEVKLPYSISWQFNTRLIKVREVQDKNYQEGTVVLTVTNFENIEEAQNDNKIPYLLSISMKGLFRWSNKLTENQIKQLIKVNAASLLFSYIRPVIAEVTANSDFKREDLPFIDFSNANEE